jgi:hypothetical protein
MEIANVPRRKDFDVPIQVSVPRLRWRDNTDLGTCCKTSNNNNPKKGNARFGYLRLISTILPAAFRVAPTRTLWVPTCRSMPSTRPFLSRWTCTMIGFPASLSLELSWQSAPYSRLWTAGGPRSKQSPRRE